MAHRQKSRLSSSSYNSPYARLDAPEHNPTPSDPYTSLRKQALDILEAMGFEPSTMVERGVVWAEDQDPTGHLMHSRYVQFLGMCIHRVMESYDEVLTESECADMFEGRSVAPVLRRYELDIYRQIRYPDALIAANRPGPVSPDRNTLNLILFSLKQQSIVAEMKGSLVYVDVKTGRPVNLHDRTDGWAQLPAVLERRVERAARVREKWEAENPAGRERRAKEGEGEVSKVKAKAKI